MIYSGDLRDTISFWQVVETQSPSGYKSETESKRFDARAQRLKNKQSLVVDAGEIFHDTRLTFRLRYRKEMDETDIVRYDGNRYRITSMDVFQKDNEVVIVIEKINE